MKKILICLLIFINTFLFAQNSASSVAYSGSYLARAKSYEANYWNPATMYFTSDDGFYWNILNFSASISNNAISINKYNEINGDSLSTSDKNDLLDGMDGKLNLNALSNLSFGLSSKKWAINVGFNFLSKNSFSEKYFELLLKGNIEQVENNDYIYNFTKENNNLNALSYVDFTYGSGNFELKDYFQKLKLIEDMPDISLGYAFSGLLGLGAVETRKFDSSFETSDETGIHLSQNVLIRRGLFGIGGKLKIGAATELDELFLDSDKLSVGLVADNVLGFIKWMKDTKEEEFILAIDSVFIEDFDDDSIYNESITTSIDRYETILPFKLSFGTKYSWQKYSASLDYHQYIGDSPFYSNSPLFSLGFDYLPLSYLPLRSGIQFGNKDLPVSVSYGIGYEGKDYYINLATQAFKHVLPFSSSRGYSIALTTTWKF